jgi:hypothetical protein
MASTTAGLFGDYFQTPEQIRKKQQEALLARGNQNAAMLLQGNSGGRNSGLANAIRSYGASLHPYIPQATEGLKRGMLEAAGYGAQAMGNERAAGALRQAAMSPEERRALKQQSILGKLDSSDPESLKAALVEAKDAGLPNVVQFIQGKITEQAATARERAVEDREYALKWAAEQRMQGVADAEIRKTLAEANKLDKLVPLEERLMSVKATVAEETSDAEIAKANLGVQDLQATINQKAAQTGLTTAQTNQVKQSVSQAAEMFPKEMAAMDNQAARDKASTALTIAQTGTEEALLPHKVAKITKESQLLGYQAEATQALTDQRKAAILNMNQTDFLREVDRLNITEEEKQALIAERVEGRAITADVQGYQPDSEITKIRVDQAVKIAEQGIDAQKSLGRSENILTALDRAATGKFAGPEAFIKSWMGQMGFEDAQRDTVANELFKVLRGEITLDAAGNLKGALSDKDLAFLQDTIPARDMSVMGLRTIFGQMAAQHAGDLYASTEMDKFLSTATTQQLRSTEVNNVAAAYKAQGNALYLFELKKQGRLPVDFVVPLPTKAQRELIKRFNQ